MQTAIEQKRVSPNRLMLEGKRFGHVIAKEYLGHSRWLCVCDCGNTVIGTVGKLKDGRRRSCGKCKFRYDHKIHGGYKTRLWRIWDGMKARCNNSNAPNFKNYGGRGIKVCKEWLTSFDSFREWAFSNGYANNLTIDRINNDQGYNPTNCRWVSLKAQANNKRTNHLLTYNGESKTISQWSESTGLSWNCIKKRIDAGWSVERTLTTPVRENHRRAV